MTGDTSGTPSLKRDLQRIRDAVGAAHDAMRAGACIDLAGLDEAVADLCIGIEALPRDAGRALRPELEALAAAFDALSTDCKRARDEATPAAEPAATRRRAVTAYGRLPGTTQE